ncbi:MAG: DUF4124 domain-containing protein [Burkholderiales bacterium]|nr:DUF4124 domain-containing protein [Burkholderiales bacterium]
MPIASRLAGFAACALAAQLAAAQSSDIFKCVDESGRAHYTNVKKDAQGRNCTLVTREVSVIPSGTSPAAAARGAAPGAQAAAASFPRVDRDTQKSRDDSRRRILEDELSAEEKSLARARQDLAEQESVRGGDEKNYQKVLDRLQPYKDAVDRHERNVAALRRELANLKQ